VLATCLIRFGDALKPQGKAAGARPYLEEGVALARGVGDRMLLSEGLRELGSLNFDGNLEVAASLTAEALALAREIGSMPHIVLALFQSIVVACMRGDPVKAKGFCAQTLELGEVGGSVFGAALVLGSFGLVACTAGEPGKGVPLLAMAFRLIGQAGEMNMLTVEDDPIVKLIRQALEEAKARLGPAAFQAAWAEGQQMTVEQALALASDSLETITPAAGPETATT
jgi:non-specific serine/threonine protein kinase